MSVSNHRRAGAVTRSLVCALTVLAVATASCSGMHKVPLVATSAGQPAVWQVKAGDTVRVTMRNGSSAEFKVQSVTPDVIVSSDGTRFASTDIRSVERRGFSIWNTASQIASAAAVAGYLVVLAVVILLLDRDTYR